MTTLSGVIDLHLHGGPDVRPRYADCHTLATQAADAGLRAILLKCHVFPTAHLAGLLAPLVPGVGVFGGVVLNEPVGGVNPRAVAATLAVGGRCVWMPTEDAANHREKTGGSGGITVLSPDGRLRAEAREVIDLTAEHGAILATGHLSPAESAAIVEYAATLGHRSVLITHPDSSLVQMDLSLQVELASAGAVMERCASDTSDKPGRVSVEELAERSAVVGAHATVLTSDLGQPHNPPPMQGFAAFIEAVGRVGASADDLTIMTRTLPARLLGLEGER